MERKSTGPWPFIWNDLPDPRHEPWSESRRTDVVMSFERLHHIAERHLAQNDGPWRALLGGPALDELRVWHPRSGVLTPSTWEACDRAFGTVLAQALTRPLVVKNVRHGRPSWLAVARNGLMVVLRDERENPARLEVITAYWPGWTPNAEGDWAWRETAWQLVLRHLPVHLLPPGVPEQTVKRFITPENWGFAKREGLWEWQGEFPEWPYR